MISIVTNSDDSGEGSLRDTILAARSGSTIMFAKNIDTVNLSSGEIVIDKDLILDGESVYRTVRRTGSSHGFRIFSIIFGARLTMRKIRIQNGYACDSGGGVLVRKGELLAQFCIFIGNVSTSLEHGGGAICSLEGGVDLSNCILSYNISGKGGAITANQNLHMSDCIVYKNEATFDGAGGINHMGEILVLVRCRVSHNRSGGDGGGVSAVSKHMILDTCKIENNESRGRGGGLALIGCEGSQITGCEISCNSCKDFGGGMYLKGNSTITDCLFHKNSSNASGGGFMSDDKSDITVIRTTVCDNRSSVIGGGIYLASNDNTFSRCTISKNKASVDGSGMYVSNLKNNYLNINDCIVSGNSIRKGCCDILIALDFGCIDSCNNLIGIYNSDMYDFSESNMIDNDPKLHDLTDNGKRVKTMALMKSSPARSVSSDVGACQYDKRFDGLSRTCRSITKKLNDLRSY